MTQDKTNFSDVDAEQQVLGTLIRYPESVRHTTGLEAHHFSNAVHAEIFRAVMNQLGQGGAISIQLVADEVGHDKRSYISKCVSAGGTLSTALRSCADRIMEMYHSTALDAAYRESLRMLSTGVGTAEIIALTQRVTDAATSDRGNREFHDARSVTTSVIEELLLDVSPHSTGIAKLDMAMGGGLYPGKAYGFAARKKIGKTILAGTISHNLNMQGVKHLFICGEMGEREIHQRSLSRMLGIYPSAFRTGYAERKHVIDKLTELACTMPKNTIYLDAPGITFDALKQAVGRAYMEHGIQGFILDYWQLVGGKESRASEASHLGEVAQWIAEIGRKLSIWSFTTAQINQEGNTRGGEGIRLAFDQVYQILPENDDETSSGRWLQMMDTRYTAWNNIGSKDSPALYMNEKGPFFEEIEERKAIYSHA